MTDARLKEAGAIKSYLDANPDATVQEIGPAVEIPVPDVVEIMESHSVDEDGKITHVGARAGGGWVKPPEPEAEEAEG